MRAAAASEGSDGIDKNAGVLPKLDAAQVARKFPRWMQREGYAVIHQLRAGRRRIPKSGATFCYLFETSLPKQLSDKQTSSQVFHGKPSHDEGVSARHS
jgi:hypothetical protein